MAVNTFPTGLSGIQETLLAAKGDLISASANDTVGILTAPSTNGYVLTSDSAQTLGIKWAAAAGGKVLQVVNATYSTEVSTTSASFGDTSLTASITPSSTSSKVLVLVCQPCYASRDSDECGGHLQLLRGSTVLTEHGPRVAYVRQTGASLTEAAATDNFMYLDSPNTTSSTTYKTQSRVKNAVNNSTFRTSNDGSMSTITLLEIGA